jgi:hypothetical protein
LIDGRNVFIGCPNGGTLNKTGIVIFGALLMAALGGTTLVQAITSPDRDKWLEARPLALIGVTVWFLGSVVTDALQFRGPLGVLNVVVLGAGFYSLRKHYRLLYALLELVVAASLGWNAATSLQLAAAIYVAVRGLDNFNSSWPDCAAAGKAWLSKIVTNR